MLSLIFDTETTGLIRSRIIPLTRQPCVIELYACLCDEAGEIVDELDQIICPPVAVTQEITNITGITPEMVKGMPPFVAVKDRFLSMAMRADEVVAHNLAFDMGIIDFEFRRLNISMLWPAKKTCTVEMTEHIKGHRLKLSALHEYLFGEPFEGAHRAKVDVNALRRCFFELRKRGIL